MDDVAFVVEEDRTVTLLNQSMLTYVDGSPGDFENQSVMRFGREYIATDDSIDTFEQTIERAFQAESEDRQPKRVELTLRADGNETVVACQFFSLTAHGHTEAVLILMRDITRDKRREQEFKQTEERMEMALDRTDSVIWKRNLQTGQLTTYPTSCPLLGDSADTIEETVHPDDRSAVAETVQTVAEKGEPATIEYRTAPGIEPVWIRSQIEPITEADGTISWLTGISSDITERKRREISLEQQNQRFDELASAVSHDLQTPLATARGRTELAIETGETGHMEEALAALKRADELREGFVDVLRTREIVQQRENVSVGQATEELWETIRPGKNASLEIRQSPTIQADPTAIQRLLENLLLNAVEHGGEAVTLSVGALEDGFFLEDDGPGVPPDDREDIFSPGFSAKAEGSGIGMTSVREIVAAHDWTVSVAEGESGGARFEIHTDPRN
jgi:signal transduction histidine kinase